MNVEQRRVRDALRRYPRGVCQTDFLLPDVIDGGDPITRLPARIHELRHVFGYRVEDAGRRNRCKVYVLAGEPGELPPPPPPPIASPPAADRACDCGAGVVFVSVDGTPHPCDVEPVGTPAVGLVARNPATGRGRVLSGTDLAAVPQWRDRHGVTLHRSHFATCPNARAHRARDSAPPGQTALL